MSIAIKAKNAIKHNHIVGNTVFNDTEYEELLDITRKVSKYFLDGSAYHINCRDHEIVFVTLVEITKRWKKIDDDENDESGFWDYVIKTILGYEKGSTNYTKLYKEYTTNIITGLNITHDVIFAKKGNRYYATLMLHALSPAKSIYNFLNLCYNIYKNDLNFNYSENDKDVCELATIRFCEILETSVGNDKSVSIGTNSYNVKIGLRTLALEPDTQIYFVDLLDESLNNINLLFYGQLINPQNYFEQLINDWWHDKQTLIGLDRKTSYKLIPAVSRNKISVKFIRIDTSVCLVIPPIRLDNGITDIFHLFVYTNDPLELRKSEELFTIRGELFDTTKQKNIDLNELLQGNKDIDIKIVINVNDKTLFKTNIKKEFILFENENEISSNLIPTSNYFLYSRNIGSLKIPENISTYASNLYNIYPIAGETVSCINRQIYFQDDTNNTTNKNTVSIIGNLSNCVWMFENVIYTVFNEKVIILIPNNIQLDGLELNIGSKEVMLSQIPHRVEDTYCLFDITEHLPTNEPLNILLYSHHKEKNLLKIPAIVFKLFYLSFSKNAFYGNDEKKLTIKFNNITNELHWINKQNELTHPFHKGNLIIKIPYIKWRIDNNEWHNEPVVKKIWYKDYFHNGSVLQISSVIKIDRLYVDIDRIIPNKTNRNFDIGSYIFTNENRTDLMFSFQVYDENMHLFTVSTKEHFYKNPLISSGNKLYWRADECFVGDEARQFKLEIFRNNNDPVYFGELSLGEDEIIEINDGVYQIKVSSKENNIFKNKPKILYENEIIIGSPEKYRFANKCFKLLSASAELDKDEKIDLFWRKFNPEYFIDKIEYVSKNGQSYYLGNLYTFYKDGSKMYLHKLKNEKGEWEQINPVRLDFVTENEFEITAGYNINDERDFLGALIYDKSRKSICNINTTGTDKKRYCCLNRYKFNEVKNV